MLSIYFFIGKHIFTANYKKTFPEIITTFTFYSIESFHYDCVRDIFRTQKNKIQYLLANHVVGTPSYLWKLVCAPRVVKMEVCEDHMQRLPGVRAQPAGGQIGGQREEAHARVDQQVAASFQQRELTNNTS
jgi:hypothetical protein